MPENNFIPPSDAVEVKTSKAFVPPSDALETKKKKFYGIVFSTSRKKYYIGYSKNNDSKAIGIFWRKI